MEGKPMLKALDVANFFVEMAKRTPEDEMTNLRVNKLLFFAQGLSLINLKRPLFEEDIQAWDFGPVVPSVYRTFKICGSERIHEPAGDFSFDMFSSDEIDVLLDVIRDFGQYTTSKLVRLTHAKGTPWDTVYQKDTPNIIISKESMKSYFLREVREKPSPKYNQDTDCIGYRDEDGYLVLPKDCDDDE